MKRIRRLLALMLALVMTLSFSTVSVSAATTYPAITSGTAIALKTDKNYNSKTGKSTQNATTYKLTLATDSKVVINWSNNASKKAVIGIYLTASESKTIRFLSPETASGSEVLALARGIYYVHMYDGYSNSSYTAKAKVKFTVTDAAKFNKTNFCRAKALSVAKKTGVTVLQTPNYDYCRWYKIKLDAKQYIRIQQLKKGPGSFTVYNSNMDIVSMTSDYATGLDKSKATCAAGTYYIRVNRVGSYTYNRKGDYIYFKWY